MDFESSFFAKPQSNTMRTSATSKITTALFFILFSLKNNFEKSLYSIHSECLIKGCYSYDKTTDSFRKGSNCPEFNSVLSGFFPHDRWFFSLFETGDRSLIHAFIESEKITALGKMIKTFINRLK